MTLYSVPICVCNDPLDCHDPRTGKCNGQTFGGCSCQRFEDSGRSQQVVAT